ncbi:MAG: hypothetical protein AAFX99_01785 [Myxococcota bacterium]
MNDADKHTHCRTAARRGRGAVPCGIHLLGPMTRHALAVVMVLVWTASMAWGQDEGPKPKDDRVYTIALYAPDILFSDGMGRATFVQNVASALSARTGYRFKGISFARSGDFSARGGVDYAIIGGTHFASSGGGKPVAYAAGSPPLALMVRPGVASAVHQLRGKTLILPRSGSMLEGFVTGAVLGGELPAREFFGKVVYTKDVGAALAAVKRGQADATLAFAPYAGQSGLRVLVAGPNGPLPVAVQVNRSIDPEVAEAIAKGWRGLGVGGGGLIRGFGGGGGGLASFRGGVGGAGARKRPEMTDGRVVRVTFEPLEMPNGQEQPLPLGPEVELVPLPPLPKPN